VYVTRQHSSVGSHVCTRPTLLGPTLDPVRISSRVCVCVCVTAMRTGARQFVSTRWQALIWCSTEVRGSSRRDSSPLGCVLTTTTYRHHDQHKYTYTARYQTDTTPMGVDHGGTGGQVPPPKSPPEFGAGGLSLQILSCCKILSKDYLHYNVGKCFFCFYSRTFTVSPAMRPPPEFQSDLRL